MRSTTVPLMLMLLLLLVVLELEGAPGSAPAPPVAPTGEAGLSLSPLAACACACAAGVTSAAEALSLMAATASPFIGVLAWDGAPVEVTSEAAPALAAAVLLLLPSLPCDTTDACVSVDRWENGEPSGPPGAVEVSPPAPAPRGPSLVTTVGEGCSP